MYDDIKNFNKQFTYEPKIENEDRLEKKSEFIVVGMGGSALPGRTLNIFTHSDYGLPNIPLEDKFVILSSYSGNTEEVIEAFHEAKSKNLSIGVIATGGKLLALAKENNVPYVEIPNTGMQPRMALGFSLKAHLKMMGDEKNLEEISKIAQTLNPSDFETQGKNLAEKLKGSLPVIYSSTRNFNVAYNWKIKLNETGKIPAVYNVLPELNHNEMTGFDVKDSTRDLSKNFYFIFLKDSEDHPQNQKRMGVLQKLYEDRGLRVEILEMKGENTWQKIFSSLALADWTAYYTAEMYGLEAEQVPMVEEFKKLIA